MTQLIYNSDSRTTEEEVHGCGFCLASGTNVTKEQLRNPLGGNGAA